MITDYLVALDAKKKKKIDNWQKPTQLYIAPDEKLLGMSDIRMMDHTEANEIAKLLSPHYKYEAAADAGMRIHGDDQKYVWHEHRRDPM